MDQDIFEKRVQRRTATAVGRENAEYEPDAEMIHAALLVGVDLTDFQRKRKKGRV